MLRPKVFGIGFQKSGTSSLMRALRRLGYRVTGPNAVDNPRIAQEAEAIARDLVPRYDAFQDNPWPVLYRFLDSEYPGSRFVLTIRPTESWIRSVVRHFGDEATPMREWIYGVGAPRGNEAHYADRYECHNQEVLEYFAGRPGDLLVFRIAEGEGWERLCPFLDEPVPDEAFPHANRAIDRERRGLRSSAMRRIVPPRFGR